MRCMKTLFERALRFAKKIHAGQFDKAGEPYIKHLARVSMNCRTPLSEVAALLHDVLEDTDAKEEWLRMRFGDEVTDIVVCLTRRNDESYMQYIRRVGANPYAREVKIADLIDNCNLTRLLRVTPEDANRLRKYAQALHYLLLLEYNE